MNRYFVVGLLFLVLCAPARGLTEAEIMRECGSAVVLIATHNEATGTIGQGSGFIVEPSGIIVTNFHVIDDAYPLIVKMVGGDVYRDILIINLDEVRDIAVIKVNGWNLPHVRLGNSDSVETGQQVTVIGNPRGLSNTISGGLLSGVRVTDDGYKLHQIDAPISPGSSGSPVFDSDGRVIGIVTSSIESGQNLNFSVPINYARALISNQPRMSLEEFAKQRGRLNEQGSGLINPIDLSESDCLSRINQHLTTLLRQFDAFVFAYRNYQENEHRLSSVLLVQERLLRLSRELQEFHCENQEMMAFRTNVRENVNKFWAGIEAIGDHAGYRNPIGLSEGLAKISFAEETTISSRFRFQDLLSEHDPDSLLVVLPVMLLPDFEKRLPEFGFGLCVGLLEGVEIRSINREHYKGYYYRIGDRILGVKDGERFSDIRDFLSLISESYPGDKLKVEALRGAKKKTFTLHIK